MTTQTVTVKHGTQAHTCNAEGTLSTNIRPLPFAMDTACEVVKSGTAPARGFARAFDWYVVKTHSGYVFVTQHDIR